MRPETDWECSRITQRNLQTGDRKWRIGGITDFSTMDQWCFWISSVTQILQKKISTISRIHHLSSSWSFLMNRPKSGIIWSQYEIPTSYHSQSSEIVLNLKPTSIFLPRNSAPLCPGLAPATGGHLLHDAGKTQGHRREAAKLWGVTRTQLSMGMFVHNQLDTIMFCGLAWIRGIPPKWSNFVGILILYWLPSGFRGTVFLDKPTFCNLQ